MQLFVELSRRCNMQCSHCLRGNAEAKDMSQSVMYNTLRKFEGVATKMGIGGGESTLRISVLENFIQNLAMSDITSYIDTEESRLWMVTNGKRLMQQEYPHGYEREIPIEDDITDAYEYELVESIPLVDALVRLSWQYPITLAVSTDKFHDEGADKRFEHTKEIFELVDNIEVTFHGPQEYHQLVQMGNSTSGNSVSIDQVDDIMSYDSLMYVTYDGYVYPSCDLSYEFMDMHKNSALCFGNVVEDSLDAILAKGRHFYEMLSETGKSSIGVWGVEIDELEDLEEEYLELKIKVVEV